MTHVRRQEHDLALANRDVDRGLARFVHHAQHHVALQLEEIFLDRVVVEIGALVGAADRHHDHAGVLEKQLIIHRRL